MPDPRSEKGNEDAEHRRRHLQQLREMAARGEELFPPQRTIDDESNEPRLTVLLHLPWTQGEPIPWDDAGGHVPDSLARSKMFRSIWYHAPVNGNARRVCRDPKMRLCPYCREWFRNPAALIWHIREQHDPEAVLVEF